MSNRTIKRFPSFILGKCRCDCGKDIPIRGTGGTLLKYHHGHNGKENSSDFEPQGGGYIHIKRPHHKYADKRGRVLFHRYELELHLGRYLTKEEDVHHIDFNKENNDPLNLMIVSKKDHGYFHCPKIDYSKRFCFLCGSNKTWTNKKGWQFWTRYGEDKFICNKCCMRLYHQKEKEKKSS